MMHDGAVAAVSDGRTTAADGAVWETDADTTAGVATAARTAADTAARTRRLAILGRRCLARVVCLRYGR